MRKGRKNSFITCCISGIFISPIFFPFFSPSLSVNGETVVELNYFCGPSSRQTCWMRAKLQLCSCTARGNFMVFFDGVWEFKKLVKCNYSVNSTSIYVFGLCSRNYSLFARLILARLTLCIKRINVDFFCFPSGA